MLSLYSLIYNHRAVYKVQFLEEIKFFGDTAEFQHHFGCTSFVHHNCVEASEMHACILVYFDESDASCGYQHAIVQGVNSITV
ncbi:hypothetical protein XENTR_v10018386 [Xenopus tropicalis]|nr:hypothetical protein XENTR_v10018386 [Xenopus tropicalis]